MTRLKKRILQSVVSVSVFTITVVLVLLVGLALAGSFSFHDEFTTSRSAGSVNATSAEPGPGTRTVVDTENKLSITGEKLSFSGGKAAPADGDPGIWETIKTRAAGLGVIFDVTITDATSVTELGWDTGQTGAISESALRITGDVLKPYVAGAAGPALHIPTDGANYQFAILNRAAGDFYLGKISNSWKWLWADVTGATATLYPGINNYSAASTLNYLRIPTTLWLPSPTISDGFSAATSDGLGHPETTGLGSGGSGLTWNDPGGTWTVAGGVAYNTPATGADLWDAPASVFTSGTYAWVPYGTNTIANVANTLEITYVSGGSGAYNIFSNANDLSSDLTTNSWYTLGLDVKVNAGSSVILCIVGGNTAPAAAITSTTFVPVTTTFRQTVGGSNVNFLSSMSAGEIVTIDNLSLKPLTLNTLFRTRDAGTANVIAEVKLGANPAGTQAGIVFNLDNFTTPTTYGLLYYDGTNIRVDAIIASGTPTSKISSAYTWAAGTILRLVRDGTELRAYVWNGTAWAQVGTTQSMNAALTGTLHGTFSTYSGNTMDDFVLYPRGTEGQWGFIEELNSLDDGGDDLLSVFRKKHRP